VQGSLFFFELNIFHFGCELTSTINSQEVIYPHLVGTGMEALQFSVLFFFDSPKISNQKQRRWMRNDIASNEHSKKESKSGQMGR
jgi:hypothetical protein